MMLVKNSSISRLNASRSVLSKSGNRFTGGDAADIQPLAGKILHQRLRTRIGDHAIYLLSQYFRLVQLFGRGEIDQLLVRNAAPQEERQARRQFEIADLVGSAWRYFGRFDLRAINEIRIDQD